jgi:hypothetical protein
VDVGGSGSCQMNFDSNIESLCSAARERVTCSYIESLQYEDTKLRQVAYSLSGRPYPT